MDLSDKKAWDDSALIDSWDEALEEYKKYHSIHVSGKKLEDVLTKDELSKVFTQRRALKGATEPLEAEPENDRGEKDMSISPKRDIFLEEQVDEREMVYSSLPPNVTQEPRARDTAATSLPPMPAMIGVQDEGLKNLLMSWYYAGYHTGLYEGRQQAQRESNAPASI